MKKKVFSLMMTLLLAFMGVAKADVVTIGDPTSTTTNAYLPGYSLYDYSYTQQIYTADEIGVAGTINSLTMWLKNSSSYARNLNIYMKEVSESTFASNTAWVSLSASDMVATFTMPNAVTNPSERTITLSTPFAYSGNGNLLIAVQDVTGSWSSGLGGVEMTANGNQGIYAYRDGTVYDPAAPGVNGTLVAKKNVIRLDITAGGGGGGSNVGQNQLFAEVDGVRVDTIKVGQRPNGAWMEPFTFQIRNNGAAMAITNIDWTPEDYFTLVSPELPVSVGRNEVIDVALATGTATGIAEWQMVALYEGTRTARIWTITAEPYDPAIPDVVELAYDFGTINPGFSYVGVPADITPTTLHDDYTLPFPEIPEGFDAVYKLTFAQDQMLSAEVSEGADGKVALYTEDFYGEGGPMANNYYQGDITTNGGTGGGGEPTTVEIGFGTSTTYVTPFNSLWGYSFVESVYTAEEIGGAGMITSISYNMQSTSSQTNDVDIFMKNVTRSTFTSTTDYETVTAADMVFSGTVTFNEGWTTITLDTPFAYNGTSNLLIGMHEYTSGYSSRYFYYTTAANSVITFYSDSYDPDPYNLGSYSGNKYTSSNRANIQIGMNRSSRLDATLATVYTAGPVIENLPVVSGTYYLVASSTDPDFEVTINAEAMPCPETDPTVFNFGIYPEDDDDDLDPENVTLHWNVPTYATAWRLVFGSTYHPQLNHQQTVIYPEATADDPQPWCTDMSINSVPVSSMTQLWNNTNYFWHVEFKNDGCPDGVSTPIWGFTTHLHVPVLTVAPEQIIEGQTATLSWTLHPDRTYRHYNIYRNGELIWSTPNNVNTTSWEIPATYLTYNPNPGWTFNVTAVYDEGESAFSNDVVVKVTGYSAENGINGYAYEQDGFTPIGGVTVTVTGTDEFGNAQTYSAVTNNNGYYQMQVLVGTYTTAVAICPGYQDAEPYQNGPTFSVAYQGHHDDMNFILDEEFYPVPNVCAETVMVDGEELVKVWWQVPDGTGGTGTGNQLLSFEAQIGTGTSTTGYMPFYTLYNYSISTAVYTAAELAEAGVTQSPITSLSWYANNAPGYAQQGITIWMANVTATSAPATSPNAATMTKVYTGSMTPAQGWNEFTFNEGTFSWDGTSNIMILVQRNNGSWNSTVNWQCHTASNMVSYKYQDSTPYNVEAESYAMTTGSNRPNIIMRGGSREVVADREQDRALWHYRIYRTDCYYYGPYYEGDPGGTIVLASAWVPDTAYFDVSWPQTEPGVYKWGVGVVYQGNQPDNPNNPRGESEIAWSEGRASNLNEDFESGNVPATWTNNSAYPWTITTESHSGNYALKSGNAGHASSTSEIEVTVNVPFNGETSFWANCQGEGTSTFWDHCDFYLDGERLVYNGANVSGWQQYTFPITAGSHNFKWSYTKDSSVNPTGDCFIIDDIVFATPNGTPITGLGDPTNMLALDRESPTMWSDMCSPCIDKDMELDCVTVNVVLNSNDSPAGTVVTFINQNEYEEALHPMGSITLNETGYYAFETFRRGIYTVRIEHEGFYPIEVTEDLWNCRDLRYVMVEILYGVKNLYVSRTGWAMWEPMTDADGVYPENRDQDRHLEYYKVMCWSIDHQHIFNHNTVHPFCQVETELLEEGQHYYVQVAAMYSTGMSAWREVMFQYEPCDHWGPVDEVTYNPTSDGNHIEWVFEHGHNQWFDPNDPNNGGGQGDTFAESWDNGLNGWTNIDADGDGHVWYHDSEALANHSIQPGTPHSGAGCIFGESYCNALGSFGQALTPDNYLVSPQQFAIANGSTVSMWASARDNGYPAEHFGVFVSTASNTNPNDFTEVQSWTLGAKSGAKSGVRSGRDQGNWHNFTCDLSAYAGQNVWIAIRHFNCTNEFIIMLDDFELTVNRGTTNRNDGPVYSQYAEDGVMLNFLSLDNVDFRLYLLSNLSKDNRFELTAEGGNGQFVVTPRGNAANFMDMFESFYHNAETNFAMLSKAEIADMMGEWKDGVNPSHYFSVINDMITSNVRADNDSCINAMPFCTSDTMEYESAYSGELAVEDADYGCVISPRNPSWYYMRIHTAGPFVIHMEGHDPITGQNRDVDFVMWGPYTEQEILSGAASQNLTTDKIMDCCFSSSYEEDCYLGYPAGDHQHNTGHGTINYHVPEVGEYYVLMITNYSNNPCNVTFVKTEGEGETDCDIVTPSNIIGFLITQDGEYLAFVGPEVRDYTDLAEFGDHEYCVRPIYPGPAILPDTNYYFSMGCPVCVTTTGGGEITCDAAYPINADVVGENGQVHLWWGIEPEPAETFTDSFEAGEFVGWTTIRNGGGTEYTDWRVVNGETLFSSGPMPAHTGTYMAMSRSWNSSAYNVDNWLITPQISLFGTLSYWVMDDGQYHEHYDVYVSTTTNDIAAFTQIYAPGNATSDWMEHIVDLSAYAGQTGYIAFRLNDYDQDFLFLDDVTIGDRGQNLRANIVSFNVYRSEDNVNYTLIGNVPANTNNYYEYIDNPGPGNFYYQVTTIYDDGCESEPAPYVVVPTQNFVFIGVTGLNENNSNVALFPNPTNGNVTIQANGMRRVTVASLLGQVLYDTELRADEYTLNMAQFNAGVYVVRVYTENGITVNRVTVMK